MSSGLPKFTRPISIAGITIESLPIDIVAQTVGNLSIDIVAQSMGNVDVNIKASAITLTVTVSGTANVDITAQSVGNLDINIKASAVTLDVDITAQSVGNLDINIKASAITLDIDITAQSVGNLDINIKASAITLDIDITAQSVGNLDINIKASAITLDIDIAAQSVDLDIKTSGGTNIVIDKLTQPAYIERRPTVSNNGETPTWTSLAATTRRGKFFPRGMRGFNFRVDVYCRDSADAGGTITVYLTPYIGAGYLYSEDIAVPAEGAEAWRNTSFNIMWNYDSLFIFVAASNTDIDIAYDSDGDPDSYVSPDSGATWASERRRYWFKVLMRAQTVGDIPVSGTINAIGIPNLSGGTEWTSKTVGALTETSIGTIYGMGTVKRISVHFDHSSPELLIYVDGTMFARGWAFADTKLMPLGLNTIGVSASDPHIQQILYNVAGDCNFVVTHEFNFLKSFEIRVYNWDAADHTADIGVLYDKVK